MKRAASILWFIFDIKPSETFILDGVPLKAESLQHEKKA